MATSSTSDMKGFFRQKKKSGGITKSKAKSTSASTTSSKKKAKATSPNNSSTYGSDVAQPAALISRGSLDLQDDYDDKEEEVLRQFDMNMVYGPCLGMTRLERWERAKALGLNPPKDIEHLLRTGKARLECLWDGRV